MSIAAIIPAAGIGRRAGGKIPKQFMPLAGKPLIVYALQVLQGHPRIDSIILVLSKQKIKTIRKEVLEPFGISKVTKIVEGGPERCFSVQNAFKALAASDELVLIHDAVRPMITASQIDVVIDAAQQHGAACLATRVTNTLKRAEHDFAYETVDRENLWSIQTPQVFKKKILGSAIKRAAEKDDFGTDECYIVEKIGHKIKLVEGSGQNIKITSPEDFTIAETMLSNVKNSIKVGTGYDVHRLVTGRKLVLGGVEIPHSKGLLGHSDADVLCHAVGDALLGAMGEGDLGKHFPDSDKKYKGISSLLLLAHIKKLLDKNKFALGNVDATVVAQKPKIAPFIETMRKNIASVLGTCFENISIKATTSEGLGYEGREEGISAQAVASIYSV